MLMFPSQFRAELSVLKRECAFNYIFVFDSPGRQETNYFLWPIQRSRGTGVRIERSMTAYTLEELGSSAGHPSLNTETITAIPIERDVLQTIC